LHARDDAIAPYGPRFKPPCLPPEHDRQRSTFIRHHSDVGLLL